MKRRIMRAIFRQGLAAALLRGDAHNAALYQECLNRMKGAK